MKEKDFVKALELRGPEFEEMLHGFRAVASIAKEEKMLPASKVWLCFYRLHSCRVNVLRTAEDAHWHYPVSLLLLRFDSIGC